MSKNFDTITKSINSVRNTIYKPGDVIEIDLPATDVAVVNPRGTKLKFNIEMINSNVCAQPDGTAGCWSLIKNIQIFDLNTNTLLEQIDECNHLVACQKHFSKTKTIVNNWELLNGQCPNYTPNSLYYSQTGALGTVNTNKVECVIDLQVSGLFRASAPLFPNILVGGVRFRITLEDVARSCTTFPCGRVPFTLTELAANTIPADDIYKGDYAQGCGAGQQQNLVAPSATPPRNSFFEILTPIAAPGAHTSIDLKYAATAPGAIPFTVDNCQVKVGQYLLIQDIGVGAAAVTWKTTGPVTNVAAVAGGVTVTFVNTAVMPLLAAGDRAWISSAPGDLVADYQMSQVELLVSSAEMATEDLRDMVSKSSTDQGMNIDYKSWNIYRDNLQAGVSNPQVTLDCTERRALSLIQLPYNPNAVIGQPRPPMRTINDRGINYQYNIANRNTPSRPVPITRVSSNNPLQFDAIHGLEAEKAVERCDIAPRFMCDNNDYFMIGRALSRREHSFDANSNNIRLAILYSTASADPASVYSVGANVINKVLESQMYHIRRLNISNGSVRVTF